MEIRTGEENQIFDIGIVCMMNYNIGNNFTNYALYQYLTDLGYSVVLISSSKEMELHCPERLRMWIKVPFAVGRVSSEEDCEEDLYLWNERCHFFLVGSDQTFRYMHASKLHFFTYLPWTEDRKYKAAYASSFGIEPFEAEEREKQEIAFYLQRFNKISVREKNGAILAKQEFGVDAVEVLDPVFLCDTAHYQEMAAFGSGRIPKEKYTFAYILDDTQEKSSIVQMASSEFSQGAHIAMLERLWECADGYDGSLNTVPQQKNEEWLAGIVNSEFVVTDSFHCICFCIIFRKQFCVVYDPDNFRGWARIRNILDEFGLMERHIESVEEFCAAEFKSHLINYDTVYQILDDKKKSSKAYLDSVLQAAQEHSGEFTDHDYFQKQIHAVKRELREFIAENERKYNDTVRKMTQMQSDMYIAKHTGVKNGMKVILWGAGDCFRRNIEEIRQLYSVQYVCDNNPAIWDKEIIEGVWGLSPKQLMGFAECFVVIMIDSAPVCFEVANQLIEMGITNFDHIENWLEAIRGNKVK